MASAMAWRSASAVAGLLAGKLGELVWDEATLIWSFKDDIDGLKETMELLNAMMRDADRRSGQDQREIMRVWMKEFKSGAYDVEDLLDKFEAIELMKQSQSKIKAFFSSYNPLLVRSTMAHKIKKVRDYLHRIEEQGYRLHLVPLPDDNTPRDVQGSTNQNSPWISGDIHIGMVGRDAEKEKIIRLLLESDSEERISVIPIVGLPGIGKTTLTKAVFEDEKAKIFDVRVWVYVSQKFDLERIGKKIISTVNTSIGGGTSERFLPEQNGDSHIIEEQLKNVLHNRRYLIVLDDVWEDGPDNLENLKSMLKHGAKGSKIILTTRIQRVVDIMEVGILANQGKIRPVPKKDQIQLKDLSPTDCWNVMRQIAFREGDDLGGLEEIGRQIAVKCSGLPLLARSLGFLISQKKSRREWEDIRDREIILDVEEDQKPLQSLMLSYYYMPLKIKLCFTYCALFSKGFSIAGEHLIQQWRALGYIQPNNDDGHHCINYLLGMSFLRVSKSSQNAPEHTIAPDKLTMHDLVHDLARIILDNELIILNASEQMTWSSVDKHCRHMQTINYHKQSKALKQFPRKIRSLHFTECSRLLLQQESFSESKYLRVLDLSGCSIAEEPAPSNILLPSYIPQLILLRYLDASGLPVSALPKSLHELQNMQTLILSNCTLETLPDDIGSLLNLGYCDLSGNSSLKKLPMSFGKLSALSFLKLSGCSKLEELPESFDELKCLRHLDMSGCCALQKLPDKFGSLPKLLFLNFSGCSKLVKLPENLNLESLEQLNLSSCHELQNLPQDFGNLDKLVFLNLSDCYKVQALPDSFCHLKHLKDLDLSDCHDLRELPGCFGNLSELQSLNLTSCSKLQSLPDSFSDLSKLKHLNLSYCVRIECLPPSFGKLMLQVLDISACRSLRDLPDSIGSMTSLAQLRTNGGNHVVASTQARIFMGRLNLPESTTHEVHETDSGDCSILELGKSISQNLYVSYLKNVKCPEDAERAKLRDYPEVRRLTLQFQDRETDAETSDAETDAETYEEIDAGTDAETYEESDAETYEEIDAETDAETYEETDAETYEETDAETYEETDAEMAQLVLENLVPPRTLEEFELVEYRSKDFPNWMLNISSYLPYLVSIQLCFLPACDSLPPLGRLPNLRLLDLWSLPGIRRIGKEFYGEEGTCRKLRVIQLYLLENLDEWWTTRSGDEDGEFLIPNLHLLWVRKCPKLKFLPYPPKSMHWELETSDEVLPERGFGRLSSSTHPFHAHIVSEDFSAAKWARLQHLAPTLERLEVGSSFSMRTLPEDTPCFPSLKSLYLVLQRLEILPEWLGRLVSLEELCIWNSPNLTSLPGSIRSLSALKKLQISGCPRLIERCRGEDAHKISHIREVILGDSRFTPGQPSEGSESQRKRCRRCD